MERVLKTTTGYSGIQIALHWLIALGVSFNYIFSEGMGKALDQQLGGQPVTVGIAPWHVYVGVAVFVLVLLRVAIRLIRGGPAAEPGLQGKAASAMHGVLYLLMIAVPLAGALAWYKGIDALGEPHALMANVILILAGLHAVMALFHQYVLKDGLLRRMMRAE